jgi:hypothetical protein
VNRTRLIRAAATALATMAALTAPTAATTASAASRTALSCHVATAAGHPITFSPALTTRARRTRVTGTFHLTGCTSPDRSQPRLHTGDLTINATSRASCGGGSAVSGSGTLTWHDRAGRRLGGSTLRPASTSVSGYNPGDALLSGTVTRGILDAARVSGSATPTSDITACVTTGLRTLTGAGTVRFQR